MQKVSITAPKGELRTAIETLYDLGIMDIEEYEGEIDTGSPFKESDQLSNKLVKTRSLLSKLPKTDSNADKNIDRTLQALDILQDDLNELEDEKSSAESKISQLKKELKYFKKFKGIELDIEDLEGTRNLAVEVGKFREKELENIKDQIEIHKGQGIECILYRKNDSQVEEIINSAKSKGINLQYTDRKGSFNQITGEIKQGIEDKKRELREIEEEIEKMSSDWRPSLEETESFLTEKVEKTEAPMSFACTERAFIAEGWIPKEDLEKVKKTLQNKLSSVHIEEIEGEEPPVEHENNSIVQPFESLTDLMARPKYGELDPSFMLLLTFPLFFGMMIGDAGYGLSMSLVFYGAMKLFPQASEMFKALLWTALATFIFGLIYGEMFGFQIYESPFYRADWWTEIFYLTIAIGVAHVNLGLLLGAYNEYVHHGIREAIFAKISWIFLQISVLAGYLVYSTFGTTLGLAALAATTIPSLAMMYMGEGIEALVEIPSLVSNILSYLRLFGVCIAAYTLAGTVNAIAGPALASGTMLGITGGVLILIVGHIMLTFIKIMEGFLQGIRLHYVEQFNWFYSGGGRKYSPFGGNE